MKLVVIIPTYNEAKNITPVIEGLHTYVPQANVLVVDDNSPDGTAGIVRTLSAKDARISLLLRQKKEGLGKAYLHAFSEVLQDPEVGWVCMFDADFSHDPKYLPMMLETSKNVDVVIGSRYVKGGGMVGWALWRCMLSRFANAYCRIITSMPVHDTTAGFNLMRASVMRAADLFLIQSSGHAFIMELKYRLWKRGARFVEVPIILENRREGNSKVSSKVIGESVIAPWKMRFFKLF